MAKAKKKRKETDAAIREAEIGCYLEELGKVACESAPKGEPFFHLDITHEKDDMIKVIKDWAVKENLRVRTVKEYGRGATCLYILWIEKAEFEKALDGE